MQKLALAAGLMIVVAGAQPREAQTWHDEQYLAGGYANTTLPPSQVPGIWVVRSDWTSTLVALPQYGSYGFCMDVDNRHVVVACRGNPMTQPSGPEFGLFRFDPQTAQYTTIFGPSTVVCNDIFNVHVNQDGDYIFNAGISGSQTDFQVMKVDRQGALTTLLTSHVLGRPAYLSGKMTTNIDTGNLLLFDRLRNPDHIYEIAPDGSVTTFNVGWNGPNSYMTDFSLTQNHHNGYIEGPNSVFVYRVMPGTAPRTTLHSLGAQMPFGLLNSGLDLQTGSRMRWVCTAGLWDATWIIWIDHATGAVTSTRQNFRGMANYDLDFYRGNHIQTLKAAPHRWTVLLSCPRSPGYPYVLAAGLSGVRPGTPLGSGRQVNLNLDPLVVATLENRLPGIWNPGPGILDAQGEARGAVDVAALHPPPGGFGIPTWIAMVVLDPKAPGGVKYVPDTVVMRL